MVNQFKEAEFWARKLESGRRLQHDVDGGSNLILGLPNNVVVEHILPKIESLIVDLRDFMGLMEQYLALNAMTWASQIWKSVMEQTMVGIAMWYEENPNFGVTLHCDCP